MCIYIYSMYTVYVYIHIHIIFKIASWIMYNVKLCENMPLLTDLGFLDHLGWSKLPPSFPLFWPPAPLLMRFLHVMHVWVFVTCDIYICSGTLEIELYDLYSKEIPLWTLIPSMSCLQLSRNAYWELIPTDYWDDQNYMSKRLATRTSR
jgi:hypothetical protein